MNKKRTFGLMLTTLLIGILIGSFVFASDTAPTWVLEDYSLLTCADYVIYQNGDTTYVRDGHSGDVTSYTTDVSAFAGARELASSDGGGLIFVQSGTYSFSASLNRDVNVSWTGCGKTTLISATSNRAFWLTHNQSVTNMAFKNVELYLGGSDTDNYTDVLIDHCWFLGNDDDNAIQIDVASNNIRNVRVTNNYMTGYDAAIEIIVSTGYGNYTYEGWSISHNTILDSAYGIKITWDNLVTSYTSTFTNNIIHDNIISDNTDDGIYIKGYSNTLSGVLYDTVIITNCSITLNHIFANGGYGINIVNNATRYTWIFGNYFDDNTSGAIDDNGIGTNSTWAGMGV